MTSERRVFKYPLDVSRTRIMGARSPVPLFVGIDPASPDSRLPTVWVEVTPADPDVCEMAMTFVGTGHLLPTDPHSYVGSCITSDGLVWHVYSEWST